MSVENRQHKNLTPNHLKQLALQILATTGTFRDVERKLTGLYGKKGNYILGRLTGDEMEEFHYTNDILARIAMKDTLKWRIMRTNFETLE